MQVHGLAVPDLMYGTAWKEDRTARLTTEALAAGFRAIDTANQRKHYVEVAVGDAVAASGIPRAELFLQTKFTHLDGQDHRLPYDAAAPVAEQVAQSFASSLEHLRTSYVDSYILHGPAGRGVLTDEDWQVWQAMVKLQQAGQTRLIGVSNVSPPQLEALCTVADKPAFVQNRCYARSGWDRQTRALCRQHGIVYQGFSLLTANRNELSQPAITRLVAKTGRSLPEVVFAFARQLGLLPLTGTSNQDHMRVDLSSVDLTLSPSDLTTLESIGG